MGGEWARGGKEQKAMMKDVRQERGERKHKGAVNRLKTIHSHWHRESLSRNWATFTQQTWPTLPAVCCRAGEWGAVRFISVGPLPKHYITCRTGQGQEYLQKEQHTGLQQLTKLRHYTWWSSSVLQLRETRTAVRVAGKATAGSLPFNTATRTPFDTCTT
jgi:hypothetical protein